MAEFTVAAGVARGLFEYAASRGASREDLALRSGIDPKALEDPDHRIPRASYLALARAGQTLCDDPALALHFAEAVNLSRLSVVGLLVQASATLGEGLVQIRRYGRLVMDVGCDQFIVQHGADGLWVLKNPSAPDDAPELSESAFAFMICGSYPYIDTPYVKEVHFTHKAPPYWRELERAFRAPVVFESHWNAVRLDPEAPKLTIAVQPRYVFGILSRHADEMLKSLDASKTTRGRVESLLLPILHTGETGMEAIARKLGLSRQTLFRRLKDEGVTFEAVLDDLRHKLALDYLAGKRVSTAEAAYLTGFSDTTAFSRAFKRWTGSTPGAARGT